MQLLLIEDSMTKKGKKRARIIEYDSDAEVAKVAPVPRVDIIYEDTKAINGAEPEFKWGRFITGWWKRKL